MQAGTSLQYSPVHLPIMVNDTHTRRRSPVKIEDIFVCGVDAECSIQNYIFYCLWSERCLTIFVHLQTVFKALQDETNQLFIVKNSKSVDPVNKKLCNSVILLYLMILNNLLLIETHQLDHRVCNCNEIESQLNYLNK